VVHVLVDDNPPIMEIRRTRERGKFRVDAAFCVMPDGVVRVDAIDGASPAIAKIMRAALERWRTAPTGVTEPTCSKMAFDYNLG
jgi:hypothetical protein